jgi:hypothetical protein
MKKLIRTGVFETNSSSCHSVSIADSTKQFVLDAIYPDKDGIVRLTGGNYGRYFYKTNEAFEKANYAAQELGSCQTLIELIKEHTGAYDVLIDNSEGYIDHESVGLVKEDKEFLKNFIFNKNSWLFLAHDEATPDPTFYVVSEFKDDIEIAPKFKYKLIFEENTSTTKFIEKPTKGEILKAIEHIFEGYVVNDYGDLVENNYDYPFNKFYEFWIKEPYINEDCSGGQVFFAKRIDSLIETAINSNPNNNSLSPEERISLKKTMMDGFYKNDEYCKSFKFKVIQLG